jgi:hypothetical protein
MEVLDKPINTELRRLLDSYRHIFLEIYNKDPQWVSGPFGDNKGIDKEYLDKVKKDPTFAGNPEYRYLANAKNWMYLVEATVIEDDVLELAKQLVKADTELFSYINEKETILQPGDPDLLNEWNFAARHYYPPGGHMSWHDNRMAWGYNIMFTWSEKGDGTFKYLDNKTKEIVEISDVPGWSTKVGYYGPCNEDPVTGTYKPTDDTFWHCFSNNDNRFTFAFYTRSKSLWEKGVEKI